MGKKPLAEKHKTCQKLTKNSPKIFQGSSLEPLGREGAQTAPLCDPPSAYKPHEVRIKQHNLHAKNVTHSQQLQGAYGFGNIPLTRSLTSCRDLSLDYDHLVIHSNIFLINITILMHIFYFSMYFTFSFIFSCFFFVKAYTTFMLSSSLFVHRLPSLVFFFFYNYIYFYFNIDFILIVVD